MSEQVKKSWAFLDGKKTAIGAVLFFLVTVGPAAQQLAVELGATQEHLQIVAAAIAAVGVAHKLWKKYFNGNSA